MPKKYRELADIAPEMVAMWQSALDNGEFSIELEDDRAARAFQTRLYSVRMALIEQKYPNSALFSRYEISRDYNKLCIRLPSWLHAAQKALEKAGTPVGELPNEDEMKAEEDAKAVPGAKLQDTLKDIGFFTKED